MKLQRNVGPSRIKSFAIHIHIVEGRGVVHFNHNDNMTEVPKHIYMLGVPKNMLSVGNITNKGCCVVFSGRQSLIINSKNPVKVVVNWK